MYTVLRSVSMDGKGRIYVKRAERSERSGQKKITIAREEPSPHILHQLPVCPKPPLFILLQSSTLWSFPSFAIHFPLFQKMRNQPMPLFLLALSISTLSLLSTSNGSTLPLIQQSITSNQPLSFDEDLLTLAKKMGLNSRSQNNRQQTERRHAVGVQSRVDLKAEKRQVPPNQGDGVPNNATSLGGTWSTGAAHVVTGLVSVGLEVRGC